MLTSVAPLYQPWGLLFFVPPPPGPYKASGSWLPGVLCYKPACHCVITHLPHTHISMNEMLGFFGVVPITVHITTHIVLYTHVDACIHVVQLINVCPQRACSTLADRALGCQEAAASAAAMALGCQEAACIGCSHGLRVPRGCCIGCCIGCCNQLCL